MDIPQIDISGFDDGDRARKRAVARQWSGAFESFGFASVVGHGVTEDLLDRIYAEARRFFDLPLEEKMRCHDPQAMGEGYSPVGIEAVGRSTGGAAPGDLCETIQFVNLHLGEDRPKHWPDGLWRVRPMFTDFAVAAAALERRLMRVTAVALDLDENYFTPFYERMSTKLRLVEYPDQPEEPLPGQMRNAAHTDYGGFTMLRQDDAPGGLQVRMPDGDWIDVRPMRGALVINAGDIIQRWTNDRFRSNFHRVINPPRRLTGSTRRLSIVMFAGPNPDTVVTCLPSCVGTGAKYPPITASEHTRERIRLAYAAAS